MVYEENEHAVWAGQGNEHGDGSPADDGLLSKYYPELVQDNGSIDPKLVLVTLIEKIKELEDKLDGR